MHASIQALTGTRAFRPDTTENRSHSQRGLRRGVVGLAVGFLLLLNSALVFDLINDYHGSLGAAARTTMNVARTMEQHAARAFATTDQTLSGVADVLKATSAAIDPRPSIIDEFLERRYTMPPHVLAIVILDAQGKVAHASDLMARTPMSLADRDYFVRARDAADSGIQVGVPVVSRISNRPVIPVARRIPTTDGSFAGVLVAYLDLNHFQRFYQDLDAGFSGTIALLRTDGTLLITGPYGVAAPGTSLAEHAVFRKHLQRASNATVEGASGFGGQEWIASYRAVGDLPLVVVAGVDRQAVLSGWHDGLSLRVVLGVVISLVVVFFAVQLVRKIDNLDTTNRRLEEESGRRSEAEEARADALRRLKNTLAQSVEALAHTVEKRDPYTAGHQTRVARLSVLIAREMGLPDERVDNIRLGALMHDIGKVGIPAELLTKPGRLSKEEFELIKTHSRIGHDIVRNIDFDPAVARIVAEHHERFDGTGYPNGLKGEHIALEARIVAVADVVEAITSHRPYRPALGLETAVNEIRKHRGSALDPAVVDACLRTLERDPAVIGSV
ncbi:HD domain-containing phosphohydrolase [Azospirillum sp.]|uniref:HD domain-containing phosphohydrolase n=1 Tax=Azospirillum sp. TaxID=34012 RepID=UPI003D74512C